MTSPVSCGILLACPGGSGAAETPEPRQVREEAAVRRPFWVPPGSLPGHSLPVEQQTRMPDSLDSNQWFSKLGAWIEPVLKRLPAPLRKMTYLLSSKGAREGYLAAIDQGIISLANFTATIILARNVSPTELGVYGVGFTALRLVRAIQEGITIQPLNTFGAAMDDDEFQPYASATTVLQILLAILSALTVAITGWLLIKTGQDTAGPAVFSLWSAFLWWQLQEYLRRMLYTRGAVFSAMLNTALSNGARLSLMIWWVAQDSLTGINGLEAIGWGSLLGLLLGMWQTRPYWTAQISDLRGTWRKNWSFGRFMLGATISNWISVEFYPVLTAGMISFAAAGAYRAIQNLVQPVQLLLRALDTFVTPRAAKLYHARGFGALNALLRKTYLIFGLPVVSLLVLAVIFRIPLLQLLYGDTYLPYANGVVLMALFYFLWFAYMPLQAALKATQTSRPIFVANLLAIAAMFSVGLWLIQRFGVYGTMAGQALNALIVLIVSWAAWKTLSKGNVT